MDRPLLKQQCPLVFVALAWAVYFGGMAYLALTRQLLLALLWIVVAPLSMWAYIRWFPVLAPLMGYGRVVDRGAAAVTQTPGKQVTLYTALGCPFCPIVQRRLEALQPALGFELKHIDVTTRPDILTRKNIWSVPVIEAGGQTFVGHATTAQLVDLVCGRPVSAAA